MWKLVSIWKNPYARSTPRPTPVLVWINPTKNGSLGIGGKDVLQEKRDYSWLKRVYGQICWAEGLGARSDWGQTTVSNPGDAGDNKYGPSSYFLAATKTSRQAGGGATNDTFEVEIPVFNAQGEQTGTRKQSYKRAQLQEKAARENRKAGRESSEQRAARIGVGTTIALGGGDASGFAETEDGAPDSIFESDEIYAPQAHVVSISTTANFAGQKEEGSVTVKSYNGLHVGVPTIFGGMGMSWGYSDFTGTTVRGCGFSGYCTGGSVTLDSDGGYTVTATGARILITIPGTVLASHLPTSGVSFEDEGGGKYHGNNVISNVGNADGVGRAGTKPEGPYVISEVPRNFGTINTNAAAAAEAKALGADAKKPVYRAHISFENLLAEINNSVRQSAGGAEIIIQKSADAWDEARANSVPCSAYPLKILWKSTPYNGETNPGLFGGVAAKWGAPQGGTGLGGVCFNGEFLCKIGAEYSRVQTYDSNDKAVSGINAVEFVNALIKHANDCCGNAFGAMCCGPSADETDKNIYIYDPMYSPGKNKGGGAGFPRTATITYDVTADMVNSFFVKLKAGKTAGAARAAAIESGGGGGGNAGDYDQAVQAVASNPHDENCAALQACLIAKSSATKGQAFVPVKLSVTTDGTCIGYKYLASFSSGHVPTGQVATPGGAVEFIATSVGQNVSGGDWTTTLNGTGVVKQ